MKDKPVSTTALICACFVIGFGAGALSSCLISYKYMMDITVKFYGPERGGSIPSHIKKQIELISDGDDAVTR